MEFAYKLNDQAMPIPRGPGGASLFPFALMKVGDSFDVPFEVEQDGYSNSKMSSVCTAARNYRLVHDPTFYIACRTIKPLRLVRVWRVNEQDVRGRYGHSLRKEPAPSA